MNKKLLIVLFLVTCLSFFVIGCSKQQITSSGSVLVPSLIVTPSNVTLHIGETTQFTAEATNISSSEQVVWTVSSSIGTIDANGLFTAVATGEGTVEARVGDVKGIARFVVITSNEVSKIITGYV